jgi:D-glycero-D-manno-heptose 1,7-bisphosphate phosphatase
MAKALFLDRDGVLVEDAGYVHSLDKLRYVPGALDLCRAAASRGFALVVATNQSGIGRGYYTEAAFRQFTAAMLSQLRQQSIAIAAVYACPFHPTEGIGPYRRQHPWRKPEPGMLLDAVRSLGLDLAASALVGDGARDILAARAGRVGTAIRIAPADAADREAGAPDVIVPSVAAAAAWFAARC